MPRLLDTNTRTDDLAHALAVLIAEAGLEAPSSRKIAAAINLNIGSLYHHYESRQRLLRVLSHQIGLALVDLANTELRRHGVGALLRSDEDGTMLTRAWLGIVELGRCDEHVGHSVAAILLRERSLLMLVTGEGQRDSERLEMLQALLHGLRVATTRYCDPLDVDVARRLLEQAI